MLELRRQIEKQSTDLGATHRSLSDLRSKNAELEERLIQVNKELHQAQELAKSLEIELNENVAQKGDQEERIATLEKRYLSISIIIVIYIRIISVRMLSFSIKLFVFRYLNSQRETTTLRDLNEKLDQELKNKEEQSALNHEKIKAINEKLDISEQKLIDYASMPDIEEQLRDRMEALTQAQERQGTAEERTQRLESQLEEKTGDVMKLTQRLKKNEEHNQRLSQTVDKLLSGMF